MTIAYTKTLQSAFIGIDVSKREFEVCIINNKGEIVSTYNFEPNRDGFNNFVEQLPEADEIKIGAEDTGPLTGNFTQFINKQYEYNSEVELIITHSHTVSRLREAFSKSTKTDAIDAFTIAQALRMDVLQDSQKDHTYVFLQDILERYHDLKDRQTALTNQLRANLEQIFPEIERMFSDITSNAALAILQNYQTAMEYYDITSSEEGIDTIRELVLNNNGRFSVKRIKELREKCKESVAWKNTEYHKTIIASQAEELNLLKRQIKLIKTELEEYAKCIEHELELLRSVPGVGEMTSYQFMAVIGNHERFARDNDSNGAKRVSSFVGFSIEEHSSGDKQIKKGISKEGNSRLRGMMYMIACSAVRYDDDLKEKYESLKQRKDSGMLALNAISHTLIRRCYGVLKSGKPYDSSIPRSQAQQSELSN